MKNNMERAREIFSSGEYKCLVVNNERFQMSAEAGLRTLLELLDGGDELLRGASVADTIVGRAAAMLMSLGGVVEVYAEVLSRAGAEFLSKSGIKYSYGTLVDNIINRAGTGICPMEEACANAHTAKEGYIAIKQRIELMCNSR